MSLKIAIIGAGPAGYPAAFTAARLGAEVTLIEKNQLGGVCLHCGCIPSKSLLDAAHRFDIVRDMARFCEEPAHAHIAPIIENLSWSKIQARQKAVTQKLTLGIATMLRQAKVTVLHAEASFIDEHTLLAHTADGDQKVFFDKAIIATGSQAFVPRPFDQLTGYVYDNSTIFQLENLPKTLAIIGAGAIGCEFATLLSAFGVQVHLIEMQPRLLPNIDENLSRIATKNLQKSGVILHVGQAVTNAQVEQAQVYLTLTDGTQIQADKILAAIGRSCDLTHLHPERVGLSWTRKGLASVNPHTLQLTDTLYAAGDVTGLSLLAHAGTRQGIVAAQNACGKPATYHNELIPNAVYTHPELASVGLNKTQAQAQGFSVKTYKSFLLANGRAQTMDDTDGYAEIITDASTDKLLGAVLAGPHMSELLSTVTVALHAGFTIGQLKEVVFAHPTLSECIAEAIAK